MFDGKFFENLSYMSNVTSNIKLIQQDYVNTDQLIFKSFVQWGLVVACPYISL